MKRRTPNPDLDAIMPLLIGVWRRFHKLSGPPDVLQTREFRSVVESVRTIKEGLESNKSLVGRDYFADRQLLGAYLLYQWVVHYQQALSILGELPLPPKRVLDVCSGPAPMAFAALRHGAQEVIATDRNKQALELGSEICGRYGMPLTIRTWDCLARPVPVPEKFDLIILGHCLEELFPSNSPEWRQKQNTFVNSLLGQLSPNGFLAIIDNSHLESNQRILMLRDYLVGKEVPIQAPCVWAGECPALKAKNSPCYAQREFEKPYLIKEIQRANQINLNSLKMSYLIVRSPKADKMSFPIDKKLYRIISPPVETTQGSRYYLCGTDGKKNLGSRLKTHPAESKAFEYLRRGELITISNASESHNSIDIIDGTVLKIEAACGKPFIERDIIHE